MNHHFVQCWSRQLLWILMLNDKKVKFFRVATERVQKSWALNLLFLNFEIGFIFHKFLPPDEDIFSFAKYSWPIIGIDDDQNAINVTFNIFTEAAKILYLNDYECQNVKIWERLFSQSFLKKSLEVKIQKNNKIFSYYQYHNLCFCKRDPFLLVNDVSILKVFYWNNSN